MSSFNKRNNNVRRSFFAEQREKNLNPGFINSLDFTYLRQSVRRIVKDINDNIISQDDYKYFLSPNLLNACLQESYENYLSNRCLRNALHYYRTMAIPNRLIPPEIDANTEMTTAGIELTKACARESMWLIIYNTFYAIYCGADIAMQLVNIIRIDKTSIKLL